MIRTSKVICIPRDKEKVRKQLQEFMKRFTKKEFAEKTIFRASKWLASQYNITQQQALGYIASVARQAMVNEYDKISGHRNRYWHQVWDGIYEMYGALVDDEWKRYLYESEYTNQVKKIRSPEKRFELLSAEMMAYLYARHKPASSKYADLIADLDWKLGGELVAKLWSKPAFWLATNILVFDVFSAHGETPRVTEIDEETIAYNFPRWYETRPYMSETERFAWQVYDEVVEEIGRELLAATVAAGMTKMGSRGLRLLASVVLNLVKFHPAVRIATTVATAAELIATWLDRSFLAWLGTQVAIEWPFESWLAIHEWDFLRNARDMLAGYTPAPWGYGFTEETYQEYIQIAKKALSGWPLTPAEELKYREYTEMAKEKGMNFAKLVDYILKMREWTHNLRLWYRDSAEDILNRELPPDQRHKIPTRKELKEEYNDFIDKFWHELYYNGMYDDDNTACPTFGKGTIMGPIDNYSLPQEIVNKVEGEITSYSLMDSERAEWNSYRTYGEIKKSDDGKIVYFKFRNGRIHGNAEWVSQQKNYYFSKPVPCPNSNESFGMMSVQGGKTWKYYTYHELYFEVDDPTGILLQNVTTPTELKKVDPTRTIPDLFQICLATLDGKEYSLYKLLNGEFIEYKATYKSTYDDQIYDWVITYPDDDFLKAYHCPIRFSIIDVVYPYPPSITVYPTGMRSSISCLSEVIVVIVEYTLPFIPEFLLYPRYISKPEDFLRIQVSKNCVTYRRKKPLKLKGKKVELLNLIDRKVVVKRVEKIRELTSSSYSFRQIPWAYYGCEPLYVELGSAGFTETLRYNYEVENIEFYGGVFSHIVAKRIHNHTVVSDTDKYPYPPSRGFSYFRDFSQILKVKFASNEVKRIPFWLDPVNPQECVKARKRVKIICNIQK